MSKKTASNKPVRRKRTGSRSQGGRLQKVSRERLNRREQYAQQDKLLKQYASGKSLESIALDDNLDMRVVVNSMSSALDRAVKNYSEPSPQHQFVRFAAFNMDLIKKLEDARKAFMYDSEGKQYSMIVSSIRAQHEIYNSIQKRGTDLGVIQMRKADNEALTGGKKKLLQQVAREAELCLEIIDEFDPHTQFRRRRRIQAQIRSREATQTVPDPAQLPASNARPYCAIIRKVVRQHGLVVRDKPNEMFRTTVFEIRNGKHVPKPKKRWSREDYTKTGTPLPDDFKAPTVIDAEYTTGNDDDDLATEVTLARGKTKTILNKERGTGTDG